MQSKQPRHTWTENDDIVAFYLYKFMGDEELRYKTKEIAELISKKGENFVGSLRRRIKNFRYLDTGDAPGGENYAALSKRVYDKYKNSPKNELRKIVVNILEALDK